MRVRDPVRSLVWAPEAGVAFAGSRPRSTEHEAAVQPEPEPEPAGGEAAHEASDAAILARRRAHLGPNLALFFADAPLHIVRGRGCELYDAQGGAFLDCISNVQVREETKERGRHERCVGSGPPCLQSRPSNHLLPVA